MHFFLVARLRLEFDILSSAAGRLQLPAMGSHRRRQLQFVEGGAAFIDRASPYDPDDDGDNDGGFFGTSTQNNAVTATDDSATISTSIGLGGATTETINADGDTLSLVVVSTVYGGDPVTSYSATLKTSSSSSPSSTSAETTSTMASQTTSTSAHDAASAGEATKSSTPSAYPVEHHHSDELSDGELATAIVVPIVFVVAFILALIFFCMRRRKKDGREREGSLGAKFIPASIKEKWSSVRTSNASSSAPQEQPVLTNTQNNAYNTGLDTSSHGSGDRSQQHSGEFTPGRRSEGGTTFEQPPPPYNVSPAAPTLPHMRQSTRSSVEMSHMPQQPAPTHNISPLSQVHDNPSAAALLAMPLDPPQPSNRSARSITSTLYSDTASVHSARAARMSIGGPHVIQPQASASRSRSGSGDPFDTEANTPVTPLSTRDQEQVSSDRIGR